MSSEATGRGSGINPVDFCAACSRFATGVAIATCVDSAGESHGMTVNSFTSVSLDPLLFLICVDKRAELLSYVQAESAVGISVLAEDQVGYSIRFSRPGEYRFGRDEWRAGVSGVLLLENAIATMEGIVERILDGGDHEIVLARVEEATVRSRRPLVYFSSSYYRIGETLP